MSQNSNWYYLKEQATGFVMLCENFVRTFGSIRLLIHLHSILCSGFCYVDDTGVGNTCVSLVIHLSDA